MCSSVSTHSPAHKGNLALLANEMLVPLILWVHCNSAVPKDGFWPSCGHRQEVLCTCHRVLEVVQEACLLTVLHLQPAVAFATAASNCIRHCNQQLHLPLQNCIYHSSQQWHSPVQSAFAFTDAVSNCFHHLSQVANSNAKTSSVAAVVIHGYTALLGTFCEL